MPDARFHQRRCLVEILIAREVDPCPAVGVVPTRISAMYEQDARDRGHAVGVAPGEAVICKLRRAETVLSAPLL